MGILQSAREKAAGVAKEAADATARAAGAAAARAGDPTTRERMAAGLSSAGHAAGEASRAAAGATAQAARTVAEKAGDPATQQRVRSGVQLAGSGVLAAGRTTATGVRKAGHGARTMIERVDPGLLAELVIKATALQERTNARLRARGSVYRIGELQVTASLPPGISFSIVRLDDPELRHEAEDAAGSAGRSSTELLADEAAAAGEAGADLSSLDPADPTADGVGSEEAAAGDELAAPELGSSDEPAEDESAGDEPMAVDDAAGEPAVLAAPAMESHVR